MLLCLTLALGTGNRALAQLNPGDLLITDGAIRGVVQIDSFTGLPNVISSGGSLQYPTGVALGPGNEIYVIDTRGSNDGSRIYEIDAASGAQTLIASLSVDTAWDIEVGADGNLYVAGSSYSRHFGRDGMVARYDFETGIESSFGGWGRFKDPTGIERGANGVLYVTDRSYLGGAVVGFDPVSSGTWVEASGGDLWDPIDLAVMNNGEIEVLDRNAYSTWNPYRQFGGATITVDPNLPTSVNQTPSSFDGNFADPAAMASTWFGSLMIAEDGFIMRVDPGAAHNGTGANQTVVWYTPYLPDPTGMDIVPGIRWFFPPRVLDPIRPPFG